MNPQDCISTQASTAAQFVNSALVSAHTSHTLASLLNDVLLQVWIHLDHPVPFSQVNKRFYELGQDTLWRAKWLMQRYERYLIIFEAIARPKIFTPALLQRLLLLRAPMSRNLAQLIHLEWNATLQSLMHHKDESVRWGRISFSAYLALMQHALTMYGDTINAHPAELDNCVFEDWSFWREHGGSLVNQVEASRLEEKVTRMFKDARFMPLPLSIRHYEGDTTGVWRSTSSAFQAVRVIMLDSYLIPCAMTNGFELTSERTEAIINDWSNFKTNEEMRVSIDFLKAEGVVNVSLDFARGTFGSPLALFEKKSSTLREVLMQLDQQSALPFSLEDVIKKVDAAQSSEEQPAV